MCTWVGGAGSKVANNRREGRRHVVPEVDSVGGDRVRGPAGGTGSVGVNVGPE